MKAIERTSHLTDFRDSLVSVREALNVLEGKWKIPIMISLAFGDKRFKEIQYQIPGLTSKVLSRELKELQINNLVTRTQHAENRVVFYSITNKCKSLDKVIEGLKEWGDYHRTNIFNRPIKTHSIPGFSLRMQRNEG